MIVPHLMDSASPEIIEWVQSQTPDSTLLVIPSIGATPSFDTAFRILSIIAGVDVAEATATSLRYELQRHPRSDGSFDFRLTDAAALYLTAGFVWDKRNAAVTIFDGIDEVALSAVLDLYPRVFDADLLSVGVTRGMYTTRNGLLLVPWLGLDEEPKIHELIVPGKPNESELGAIRDWAAEEEVPAFNPFGGRASNKFAYDAALEGIAAARSAAVARAVANTAQYALDDRNIDSAPAWPYDVMVVPLAFGLLALFVFRIGKKRRISDQRF